MKYIATVYSHFQAMQTKKILDQHGINTKLSPVPRALSSSCGTCVLYESDEMFPESTIPKGIEIIAKQIDSDKYDILYKAGN